MKNLESKSIKWKIEFDDYLKQYIHNNSIVVKQRELNIAYVRFLCPVNYSDLSVLKFVTEIESSNLVTISIAEFDRMKRQIDSFDYFIDKVFPTLTFDSEREKVIKEGNPKIENITFVDHINFINDINNVSQKRNIDNIESVPFGSEKDKQLFVKLNMLKTTFKY